jgi:hypothetical protein
MSAMGFLPAAVALYVLAQTPVPYGLPSEFGQPLLIAFCAVVAVAYHKSQEARVKRAEGQVDALTSALPELLNLMRDWKEAQRERSNPGRS